MPKGLGRPYTKGAKERLDIAKRKKPVPKWAADPKEWVGKEAKRGTMKEIQYGFRKRLAASKGRDPSVRSQKKRRPTADPRLPAYK